MEQSTRGDFIYTLLTSGVAYLMVYLVVASKYTDEGAAISLAVGFFVYLIIRMVYKKDEGFDKISAKAYRLAVWLVPLILISIYLILFFINPSDEPRFKPFYTLDDLLWSNILIIFFFPVLNFLILIANFLILIWMMVYYMGAPVFIGVTILVLVALISVYKKLHKLNKDSVVQFSLALATVYVLTPIVGYTLFVYLWFDR